MKCKLCNYESDDRNDFYAVKNGSNVSECGWDRERECKRGQSIVRKQREEQYRLDKVRRENEMQEKIAGRKCDKTEEELKEMSIEEEFECRYNLSFDDLIKDEEQYRDCCTRYTHPETNNHFRYNFSQKRWLCCGY